MKFLEHARGRLRRYVVASRITAGTGDVLWSVRKAGSYPK
jgi:hypothetical protein